MQRLDAVAAEHAFSGVVRVDSPEGTTLARAYGEADRAHGVPNTVDTRFGLASVAKGLTALTVMTLVEEERLRLDAPARAWLGADLPLVHDDVTVEQLLAHRSGIGDYLDEDAGQEITDHVMPVPVHRLATTEDYLPVLDGLPQKFSPGERFSYCNSGYVVLALLVERCTGAAFHDEVRRRVLDPAGMAGTAYLRSDELPGDTARGYLHHDGLRTNVLHLPVRGSGDGGVHATVADLHLLWRALADGRIVSPETLGDVLRPRSVVPQERRRYALGFWLAERRDVVMLEGLDVGVSCRTVLDRETGAAWTVVANTTYGAWPVVRHLTESLSGSS